MPTIQALLSIQINQATEQATVTIFGNVFYSSNELQTGGTLECHILGDDPINDDFLFTLGPVRLLPQETSFRLEREVPRSDLNEDIIGPDEIVANVTFQAFDVFVSQRTNVVQIRGLNVVI